jgi:hypothetical protein
VNRHAAAFTFLFLRWLVGPMKMNDVPEDVALDKPNAKMPPSVAAAIANALKPDGVDFKDNGYRCAVDNKKSRKKKGGKSIAFIHPLDIIYF